MNRQKVKIDANTLKDLARALAKFRTGIDYSSNGMVAMAISGLSQLAFFHPDAEFEVFVPEEK